MKNSQTVTTGRKRPRVHGQSSTIPTDYCGYCPPERRHCYYRRTSQSHEFHQRFSAKGHVRSEYRLTERAIRGLLIIEGP